MDLIDRKILCELDLNCRTPLSQLAKRLKIGRNVVDYRIKNLEKEGVIEKYICSLNLGLLGFKTYKINFEIRNTKEEKEFAKYLAEHRLVINCVKEEGAFDYSVSIAVRNIGELDEFLMTAKNNFKDLIKDYAVSIIVHSKIFKLNKLLLGEKKEIPKIEKYSGEEEKIEIDENDKKILRVLSQEANLPIVELARRTKLSIDIVKYRLKNLSSNLKNSFRVLINFNKLGYHTYVVMLKIRKATKQDEEKLVSWCAMNQAVLYCSKRVGYYDFTINIAIKSIEELNNFISNLREEFSEVIDSYETILNSDILKLNYVPF
ncbi:Lrp/AsnC family transcriptional regulator [Candidatus Woesearchaeota archaeon]|nr:Lrp/AsnC family transcriptional regulator [Candidatus Woesearchaeota archaeon]